MPVKLITDTDEIKHLNELITRHDLGPTTAVGTIAGTTMVQIELDGTITARSELLDRWMTVLTVNDMVCGKRDNRDPLLRLHLRGSLPGWPHVCLTMSYREFEDAAHCATIRDLIDNQDPDEMIDALSRLDAA